MKRFFGIITIFILIFSMTVLTGCDKSNTTGTSQMLTYPIEWKYKHNGSYLITLTDDIPDGYSWQASSRSGICAIEGPVIDKDCKPSFKITAEMNGEDTVSFALVSEKGVNHTEYTILCDFEVDRLANLLFKSFTGKTGDEYNTLGRDTDYPISWISSGRDVLIYVTNEGTANDWVVECDNNIFLTSGIEYSDETGVFTVFAEDVQSKIDALYSDDIEAVLDVWSDEEYLAETAKQREAVLQDVPTLYDPSEWETEDSEQSETEGEESEEETAAEEQLDERDALVEEYHTTQSGVLTVSSYKANLTYRFSVYRDSDGVVTVKSCTVGKYKGDVPVYAGNEIVYDEEEGVYRIVYSPDYVEPVPVPISGGEEHADESQDSGE